MFNRIKKYEDFDGSADLLNPEQVDTILKWGKTTTYAAIHNNGFLDIYLNNGQFLSPKSQVLALSKCDVSALMGYKGMEELRKNADIYECELIVTNTKER